MFKLDSGPACLTYPINSGLTPIFKKLNSENGVLKGRIGKCITGIKGLGQEISQNLNLVENDTFWYLKNPRLPYLWYRICLKCGILQEQYSSYFRKQ